MCLSSPEGDENYYSQLMNLDDPDTGEKFFRIQNHLLICEDCLKLETPEEQLKCNHVKQTAFWLSKHKFNRLKHLYSTSPELAQRELQGKVVSDYTPCFRKEEIKLCFEAGKFSTQTSPNTLFIACDPNGGGPSHMAIATGYYTTLGNLVIVGLESEPVKDDKEEYLLLKRHIEKINSFKIYRNIKKVFIPENNLGLEAAHLDTMVNEYPDIETFWETDKRPGVRKTAAVTRNYQFLLNNMLAQGGMHFDRDLFTVSRRQTPNSILVLLRTQMETLHWETKPAIDAFGNNRYAITGKSNGKNDDLVIAVQQLLYWARAYVNNPRRQ